MVHPQCSLGQSFLPFSGQILFIPLSVSIAFCLSTPGLLAVVSNAALDIDRQLTF